MGSRNELRGVDVMGSLLWVGRQVTPDETTWEGTGITQAGFLYYRDLKAFLASILMFHPDTNTIQGVLDGEYKIAMPSNAAAITIIDAIMKELGR